MDKFEKLVKRISPKLKAITRRFNWKIFFDEDDLYQEALLYLWEKWKKNEILDKTDSFILQGCFFFLKNYIRKAWTKIDFINASEEILHEWEGNTFFNYMDNKLLIEEMERRLTEREKIVFSLYLEGFTIREIGKKLGISHVMVIKIKKKIRDKCKDLEAEII